MTIADTLTSVLLPVQHELPSVSSVMTAERRIAGRWWQTVFSQEQLANRLSMDVLGSLRERKSRLDVLAAFAHADPDDNLSCHLTWNTSALMTMVERPSPDPRAHDVPT